MESVLASRGLRVQQEPINLRIQRLRRTELPVATLAMARFLIGKTLIRELRVRLPIARQRKRERCGVDGWFE